jgi:hypothetical protein
MMSRDTIVAIKDELDAGFSHKEIASHHGVSSTTVCNVAAGDFEMKLFTAEQRVEINSQIIKDLKDWDGLTSDDPEFNPAMVLMASVYVGQLPKNLSLMTGVGLWDCVLIACRMRESGLWNKGKWFWELEPGNSVEFAIHVLVASGTVVNSRNPEKKVVDSADTSEA